MSRSVTSVLAVAATGLTLAVAPAVAATAASNQNPPAPASGSPAVGPQKTWTGRTAPLTLPGTGIKRGERLPKGSVLVYRTVNVPRGAKRLVKLTVPKGEKLITAAQSGSFGSGVVNRNYVGKRSVTIRVAGGRTGAQGRMYAYAR